MGNLPDGCGTPAHLTELLFCSYWLCLDLAIHLPWLGKHVKLAETSVISASAGPEVQGERGTVGLVSPLEHQAPNQGDISVLSAFELQSALVLLYWPMSTG